MAERVHLIGPVRPERVHRIGPVRITVCGSSDASERRTTEPTEVTCQFCSALFLAEHPEYVLPGRGETAAEEEAPDDRTERRRAFRAGVRADAAEVGKSAAREGNQGG